MNDQFSKEARSSSFPFFRLAVLAGAGYMLWTNRFRIQRFLESQGVSTPWMNGNIGEAIASGAAKVGGAIEGSVKSLNPNSPQALKKDAEKALHS